MSLNDDADLELLDQTAGYLQEPNEKSDDNLPDLTISAGPAPDEAGEVEVQQALDSVANYDVKIKAVQDKDAAVHDLDDIIELVQATETVDQGIAARANQALSPILGDDSLLNVNQFTQVPTKVGSSALLDKLRRVTAEASDEKRQALKDFLELEVPHIKVITSHLVTLMPELIQRYESLQDLAAANMPTVSRSKNFLYYYVTGQGEVSKDTCDIRSVVLQWDGPFDRLYDPQNRLKGITFKSLRGISGTHGTLVTAISYALKYNSENFTLTRSLTESPCDGFMMTYENVVAQVLSGQYIRLVSEWQDHLKKMPEELERLMTYSEKLSDNLRPKELDDFLFEVRKMVDKTLDFHRGCMALLRYELCFREVITTFAKLA